MWNYNQNGSEQNRNPQAGYSQEYQPNAPQYPNAPQQPPQPPKKPNGGKSRGLAVFFGLLPGAGHMYLGKMMKGLTFMILFWGIIALASVLEMGVIILALPVLWFYAFFDNLNLAGLTAEERAAVPDELFFGLLSGKELKNTSIFRKRNVALGVCFIAAGVIMLVNMTLRYLLDALSRIFQTMNLAWLWSLYYSLPRIVVAVVVIVLGVYFVRGGKKKAPADDVTPYQGK